MTTEAKAALAGLMVASAPPRAEREPSLPMFVRVSAPVGDAKCSHPRGINGLLTITIY
jgi:hypothetical protein